MRVLLNILIILIAWPVLAFDPYNLAGWGGGVAAVESAFYPPIGASTRYTDGTNWHFAKDVWAEDFAEAVNERLVYAGLPAMTNEWEGVRVPWEHERLHELKQGIKAAVPGYINLKTRSSGNYNEWFNQWNYEGAPYGGTNYPLYLSHVFEPPNWTFATTTNSPGINNPVTYTNSGTAFFDYTGLPTNFFEYTPARFLGATSIFYTNEYTASGGPLPDGRTNEWNTLDYGWGGMTKALAALKDLRHEPNLYLSEIDGFYDTNLDTCDVFRGIGEENFNSNWISGIHGQYGCLGFSGGETYYEMGLYDSSLSTWGMTFQYHSAPYGATSTDDIVPLIFEMFEAISENVSHRHAIENDTLMAFQIEIREPSFFVYHAVVYQTAGGSAFLSNPSCPVTNYLDSAWGLYSSSWDYDDNFDLIFVGNWMPVVPPQACCATLHSGGFPGWPLEYSDVDPALSCIQATLDSQGMEAGELVDQIGIANEEAPWHAFDIGVTASRSYSRFTVFRPDFVY